jgi:hypothetical protein
MTNRVITRARGVIPGCRAPRGRDPETGELLNVVVELRSDRTPEQRPKARRIGRIGFASAGAKRKAA